jgi:excisionase family DNA binding protein
MERPNTQLMSVREAAKCLNVSPHALYRRIEKKELPSFRMGRKILVDLGEMLSAMRSK